MYSLSRHMVLALIFLLNTTITFADVMLRPMIVEPSLMRGATTTIEFTLVNTDTAIYNCGVAGVNITQDATGRPVPDETGTGRGCGDWLTFSPQTFTLQANGQQVVKCKIKAPTDTAGAYYAFATFLLTPKVPNDPNAGGIIRRALNPVLMVTVGGGRERLAAQLNVTSVGLASSTSEPWRARVEVKNNGNMHAKIRLRCTLTTETGALIEDIIPPVGKGNILAGCSRTFEAVGKIKLGDGRYNFRSVVQVEGSTRPMVQLTPVGIVRGQVTSIEEAADATQGVPFTMQPGSLDLNIPPRGCQTHSVSLINLTATEVRLHPVMLGWSQSSDGEYVIETAPQSTRALPAQVSVRPEEIIIPAKGKRSVAITVVMPETAIGEYYAAIAFKQLGKTLPQDPYLLLLSSTLVTFRTPGTPAPEAVVNDMTCNMNTDTGENAITLSVQNPSAWRCAFTGDIQIVQGAETIERLFFGSQTDYICAGSERKITVPWSRLLPPGRYQIVTTVTYAEGKETRKEISIDVEPRA